MRAVVARRCGPRSTGCCRWARRGPTRSSIPEAIAAARDRALREPTRTLAGRRVILYAPTFRGRGAAKRGDDQLDAASAAGELAPAAMPSSSSRIRTSTRAACRTEGYDVIAPSFGRHATTCWRAADVLVTDYSSSRVRVRPPAQADRPAGRRPREPTSRIPGLYLDMRTDMVGALVTDTDGVAAAHRPGPWTSPPTTRSSPATWAAATGMPAERFVERFLPAPQGGR